jgi:tRNA nucleotidyltransferase/poly(A) polymerase
LNPTLAKHDDLIRAVSSFIGQKAYLAGGAVRDAALGRPSKDMDLVTVGGHEGLVKQGWKNIKQDFPVFTHKKFPGVELALARGEKKVGKGHSGFDWYEAPDLKTDLERRDLTINSMAYHPEDGVLDYHGGMNDLKSGTLRATSAAFGEDPLRTFRVARFAAKFGFKPHPSLVQTMQGMAHELPSLSKDRVRDEYEKALSTDHPSRFFETLRAGNSDTHWFPEVAGLRKVPSSLPHDGSAYDHTMATLDATPARARHLVVGQQMGQGEIDALGNRLGYAQRDIGARQAHAMHARSAALNQLGGEDAVNHWNATKNLRDDHFAALEASRAASGLHHPSYGPDPHVLAHKGRFAALDAVKFTPDEFKKVKRDQIGPFKMQRYLRALSESASTARADLLVRRALVLEGP